MSATPGPPPATAPTPAPGPAFREQVISKFTAAFGEPEVGKFTPGDIYRWVLNRGPYAMSMFITIDSPEFPHMAHVMISDGAMHQAEPLVAVALHTLPDADLLIQRITTQWKSIGKPPVPPPAPPVPSADR